MPRIFTKKDAVIGNNIRALRIKSNLSLNDVAKTLNVTYQQLQKYENGSNRICASKLHDIALFFGVDINEFFKD